MSVIAWTERTEIVKDPGDAVMKHFDYSRWLVGAAIIASSNWAITCADEESPTLAFSDDSITNNNTYASVKLSGGTAGKTYTLTNTIVTNEAPAQTLDRSIDIVVRDL
jgi:hypothetical protein